MGWVPNSIRLVSLQKGENPENLREAGRGDRGRGDAATGQGPPGPPETGRPSSNASGRARPRQDLDLRPLASGSAREQISLALSHPACGTWLRQPRGPKPAQNGTFFILLVWLLILTPE